MPTPQWERHRAHRLWVPTPQWERHRAHRLWVPTPQWERHRAHRLWVPTPQWERLSFSKCTEGPHPWPGAVPKSGLYHGRTSLPPSQFGSHPSRSAGTRTFPVKKKHTYNIQCTYMSCSAHGNMGSGDDLLVCANTYPVWFCAGESMSCSRKTISIVHNDFVTNAVKEVYTSDDH